MQVIAGPHIVAAGKYAGVDYSPRNCETLALQGGNTASTDGCMSPAHLHQHPLGVLN